jgi:hypothetical protein
MLTVTCRPGGRPAIGAAEEQGEPVALGRCQGRGAGDEVTDAGIHRGAGRGVSLLPAMASGGRAGLRPGGAAMRRALVIVITANYVLPLPHVFHGTRLFHIGR